MKLFVARGASINRTDRKGRTPFFLACQGDSVDSARFLLEVSQGCEVNPVSMPSSDGKTPLRKAATRGNMELVKMLLEKIDSDSAINEKDVGLEQTALHVAAYNGHRDVVEILLKAGADVKSMDKDGKTPIDLCSQGWAKNAAETAEATLLLLLDQDFEALTDRNGLLCMAAVKGSTKVIEKLIEQGTDPYQKDEHGWTPLVLARQYQHKEAVEALSQTDPVIKTKPTRWTSSVRSVTISEDGLEIEYNGGRYAQVEDFLSSWSCAYFSTADMRTSVMSNHPIPAGVTKYYFEIEIIKDSSSSGKQYVIITTRAYPQRDIY